MQSVKRTTRQHRSGNSFSVRLPRDMAYPDPDQELEIEARGDERVIRPRVKPQRPDWPKPSISVEEMFARLDARGPSSITDDALIRAEMPDRDWHRA